MRPEGVEVHIGGVLPEAGVISGVRVTDKELESHQSRRVAVGLSPADTEMESPTEAQMRGVVEQEQ